MPILKYILLCILLLFQVFSGFSQQNEISVDKVLQNPSELLDSLGINDSILFHPEQQQIFTDSLGAGLKSLFSNDEISEVDTVRNDSLPNVPIAKKNVDTTIDYHARDSIFFDLESQEMFLYGEAKIEYGAIELEAERIDIDWVKNTLKANYVVDTTGKKIGKPVFTEAGEQYVTDDMTYNFQSRKAIINGIITEQDGAFMHGVRVKKNEKDELFVNEARYTTCNLADPHFHIASKRLKVVPGNKVISGPFNLHFKNIPTPLGFFFGMFPQPRKESSGIIVPSWGEDPTRGFFLRDGGYYFSISDYIDLRLTGEIYSRGNYGLRAQSTYTKRYRYSGNFSMRYNKTVGTSLDNPAVSKDFWVNWSHSPKPRGTSRFSASVSAGTSSYNQNVNQVSRDFTTSISSQFQSNVSYSKTFQGTPFNMTLNLRHNQNVQTGAVSLTFPELSFNATRIYPFKNSGRLSRGVLGKLGFAYNMVAKNDLNNNAISSSGLNIVNRSDLDGEMIAFNFENLGILLDRGKIGMRHNIPITTTFKALKYFSVTPSFNYTEVWYPKALNYSYDESEEGIRIDTLRGFSRAGFYNTGANMNTTIYGTYFFNGKKIQAVRHVMIPSVGFSYSPDFSDPSRGNYQEIQVSEDPENTRLLSRYNGFAYGGPGTGRSVSMNFSLTNNIEMKVRTKNDSTEEYKKVKLFDNLSFSSSYNFLADSLKLSAIGIRAKTSLFNRAVSLGFSGNIDPYIYILDSIEERTGGNRVFHQTQIDKLAWNAGKGLGQLSTGNVTLVINLRPKNKSGKRSSDTDQSDANQNDPFGANQDPFGNNDPFNQDPNNPNGRQIGSMSGPNDYDPNRYVDFDVPWNLGINYSLNYRKRGFEDARITQTLGFNGNVSITDKTKISFNSGYDIKNKEFTVTRLNLTRDLHCWTMSFSWVPFGPRQEYFVEIRVLSTLLKDLKIDKKRRQQFTTF